MANPSDTLRRLQEQEQHTLLDPLTGTRNQHSAQQVLTQRLLDLQRNSGRFGVCLLAVDQHQALSDRFGKEASDAILKTVASVIMGTVRAHDLVVRWSADKFLVILSQKRDSDLKIVAERIRKLLMATPVKIGAETINITISLSGTNALLTDTVESLLTRAHSLLALSANRGHNHTTFDETVDAHK